MPFYYVVDNTKPEEQRIATKLLELKDGLSQNKIPIRTVEGTLMLASWNIREFGDSNYGVRGEGPIYYIAEIISRFDLVAVQEIRSYLGPGS